MKIFNKSNWKTDDIVEFNESNIAETKSSVVELDEMKKVVNTVNEIKEQNIFQSAFSSGKNEKALAENDAIISNVIKSILNWLAVITSAETVRKEEYEELTSQMLQFDQDINEQLEMQVKFKKAYEIIIKKQYEQNALFQEFQKVKRENNIIKIISIISMIVSFICIVITALAKW